MAPRTRTRRPGAVPRGTALAFALTSALLLAGCGDEPPAAPEAGAPATIVWGGPGRTDGRFVKPRAMAVGKDRVYIVDMTGRLQVFDLDGNHLASWTLPLKERGYPTGLALRADGAVAVAITHDFVVKIFSPQGELLQTVGAPGSGDGEFHFVTDVAFDSAGNLYVSEHGGERDRIQKFDPEGNFLLAWGASGEAPGAFHRPQALAVDGDDLVYVADSANHRVQTFTGEGRFVGEFGGFGSAPGEMKYPYDVDVAPDGTIFVCEYGNNRVQAFDAEGRPIGEWGKAGRAPGDLAAPWGVCFVPHHGLYVLDTENHRVQVFSVDDEVRAERN